MSDSGHTEENCPSEETLVAYVGGHLDELEGSRLASHVDTCASCRRQLIEAGRALVESLGGSLTEDGASAAAPAIEPAPAPAKAPAPGDRVGRYLILDVLGEGAMGVVFSALDPELARHVALKLVRVAHRDSAARAELEGRLIREAQAMARLSHRNVVAVYDIGQVESGVWIAIEHVAGVTLREWLRAGSRPWRVVLDAFLQAGDGLAAAHAAGIVHRDFKPDNVLCAEDGRVLVTDFGLARVAQVEEREASAFLSSSDLTRTRAGTLVGTPAYMAPEQLGAGEVEVDHRADVFAFGVALYQALYETRPYAGATLGELERALALGTPREPPKRSVVPSWVRRAVMRAIVAERDRRTPSMTALLRELRADPREKLVRMLPLGAIVLLAVGVVVVWYLTTAEGRACRASASLADEVWGSERRAAARAAFLASGVGYAAEAFDRAGTALDEHLAAWRRERIAACDATYDQAVQSEALLDLRLHCLDQRLSETRELAAVFTRAEEATVERASEAVARLGDSGLCAEVERLRARVPPPTDPDAAALVERAEAILATAEAAELTGDSARGASLAREALVLAERAEHPPTEADAMMLLARSTLSSGDVFEAIPRFLNAIWRAVEAGDDRVAARAAIQYGLVSGGFTVATEAALAWLRLAEAEIARLGGDAALGLELLGARATLIARGGGEGSAEVVADLERALAEHQRTKTGGLDVALLGGLKGLGFLCTESECFASAVAALEEAVAHAGRHLGQHHPMTMATAMDYGRALCAAGRYAAAEAVLAPFVAEVEETYLDGHYDAFVLYDSYAWALAGLGRFDEALSLHVMEVAILAKLRGSGHADMAFAYQRFADTRIAAGQGEAALRAVAEAERYTAEHFADKGAIVRANAVLRALALEAAERFDEAFAAFEALEGQTRNGLRTELAATLGGIGRGLLRAGRAVEAIDRQREALAVLESVYGSANLELLPALRDLGAAYTGAGRLEEARQVLERALAIHAGEPCDPLLGAEVRTRLAEVVAASDPTRAESLRREAEAVARRSAQPRAARLVRLIRAQAE